jgi:hypothetical protein
MSSGGGAKEIARARYYLALPDCTPFRLMFLREFWKMRENGFPRDRHYKSTRDKECREREKVGFVQDSGVLRGFRAGFSFDYAYSPFFCSSMQSVAMGVDRLKRAKQKGFQRLKMDKKSPLVSGLGWG